MFLGCMALCMSDLLPHSQPFTHAAAWIAMQAHSGMYKQQRNCTALFEERIDSAPGIRCCGN
jgi:hypothetical protein